jgi:hypothetical protein
LKKRSLILLMYLGVASATFAQTSTGGVTMSTDPAKIASIERHAAELKARPASEAQAKPVAKQSTSAKTKTQTTHSKAKTKTSSATKAKPAMKTSGSTTKPVMTK